MAVRVKICGITSLDDARTALDAGADALGFNFYDKSPRFIAPEEAGEAISRLEGGPEFVGVFVKEPIERVIEISSVTGINAIQLHGDEPPEYVSELRRRTNLRIIKAVRIGRADAGIPDLEADAVLLDVFDPGVYGGSGKSFDWSLAADLRSQIGVMYLAGGLGPDNVTDAVRIARPDYVDAASRLEISPGKKDAARMKEFIRIAKSV
jgi:phosphoribosylanthranilate isomerase